ARQPGCLAGSSARPVHPIWRAKQQPRRRIMPTRTSSAEWLGALRDGKGQFTIGKSAFTGSYSFVSRFESGEGTNPEELLGAAHAACFSMALSAGLGAKQITPTAIRTSA